MATTAESIVTKSRRPLSEEEKECIQNLIDALRIRTTINMKEIKNFIRVTKSRRELSVRQGG